MKTKSEIVQRLLDNKHITAEEATVLLREVVYNGIFSPSAPYPIAGPPKNPFWYKDNSNTT